MSGSLEFLALCLWESVRPGILLAHFSLCLTLLVPSPRPAASTLFFICLGSCHSFYLPHLSVSWFLYLRKSFCAFNCDYNRNQLRSVLCSKYTKDCIPFRVTPFPGNILALHQKNINSHTGDLEEGVPFTQWTSCRTCILASPWRGPLGASAAPGRGLGV